MFRPRRPLLVWFCALWSLVSAGFGPPVLVDRQYPPSRLFPEQVTAVSSLRAVPEITAPSALVVDLDANQVIFALRINEARSPASTAKIMTALLVVQRSNLDSQVRVSFAAAGTQGSRMGLEPGEVLTVRDLLVGLLLPSGNDAAVALAESVAGSEAAFVALMNQRAASLGLATTRFTNPHGLDDPGQVTSAADLAVLARQALSYPVLAEIFATNHAWAGGHELQNTNLLLGSYPGADGVKTGTTDAAGECLVASVSREGHRLLAVVLGSTDRYADATKLLDYARAGWRWDRVTLPEDGLAWIEGPNGARYRLRVAEGSELFLPVWQWQSARTVRVLDGSLPLTGTLPIGAVQLVSQGRVVASLPLTVWRMP